jgi:hypothetical protein
MQLKKQIGRIIHNLSPATHKEYTYIPNFLYSPWDQAACFNVIFIFYWSKNQPEDPN